MLDYVVLVYEVWYYDGLAWKMHTEGTEEKAIEYIEQNKADWENWRLHKIEVADINLF